MYVHMYLISAYIHIYWRKKRKLEAREKKKRNEQDRKKKRWNCLSECRSPMNFIFLENPILRLFYHYANDIFFFFCDASSSEKICYLLYTTAPKKAGQERDGLGVLGKKIVHRPSSIVQPTPHPGGRGGEGGELGRSYISMYVCI